MGCDIHAHAEIKIKGKWEHYSVLDIDRWYSLFGKMAGVRDLREIPIVQPRGFPGDASLITQMDYDFFGVDAHTSSWFGAKEIKKLEKWVNKQGITPYENFISFEHNILHCYLFGSTFTSFKELKKRVTAFKEIQDVRIIFWFDN